jgi:hypothetical protein
MEVVQQQMPPPVKQMGGGVPSLKLGGLGGLSSETSSGKPKLGFGLDLSKAK